MAARVSVIIPAFNLARYLPAAIESALSQDDPGGLVEVIVVDDGSTDETPRVLQAYSDRVRVIRQRNSGLVAAVDRGLAAVTGEYVALLDADDEWPRDRLRRHVRVLEANPTLGLVHSDMEVIDSEGDTLHSSFFAHRGIDVSDGRVLGRLLAGNFISGGSSTYRGSLLPALHPIAADAAYPDWWLAACVAAVAEVTHEPGIGNRYRSHGRNMSLGSRPEQQAAIQRLELPWRRWMMRHLVDDDTVTVDDLRGALAAFRFGLLAAATAEPGGAGALLEGDDEAAALSLAGSDDAPASKRLMRALSYAPFDGALGIDLDIALLREAAMPAPEPSPPLIALETRSSVTIGWTRELVEHPALLREFAAEARVDSDQTLVILASSGAELSELIELVSSDPALSDERCDITVITEPATAPAKAWLAARASSRLTASLPKDPYQPLPPHRAAERAAAQAHRSRV